MPSKRDVLAQFSRDELVAAVDEFELTVTDRRVKDQLLDAVASSKKASLGDILAGFPRDRLKEICRALGLDDGGREKATLVDRLTGAKVMAEVTPAPAAEPAVFTLRSPEPQAAATIAAPKIRVGSTKPSSPRGDTTDGETQVLSYRHADRRKNNPEVGMVDPDTDPAQPKTSWAYDPHIDPALQFDVGRAQIEMLVDDALASGDQEAMRRALEQLRRMSGPYLNWTGKAERTSFEVDTVSLHVHERIDPASILNAVRKRMRGEKGDKAEKTTRPKMQMGLFSAPFENLPLRDAIDFYKHDKGWSNRMIAGDSLLVMNSLLQKEGMAGQVQMIYIDPPYGIKYGSNFQPFTNRREVKDRADADLTQEPEMIKAFRDTWELGLHSYLTYLRDRLLLAQDLLAESGSVFVQISDENLHHVRELLDEIFKRSNFVSQIAYSTTTGTADALLSAEHDHLLWYAKNKSSVKYRSLWHSKGASDVKSYKYAVAPDRVVFRGLTVDERRNPMLRDGFKIAQFSFAVSQDPGDPDERSYAFRGGSFDCGGGRHWKTKNPTGLDRLSSSGRLIGLASQLNYIRLLEDYPLSPVTNVWSDTGSAGYSNQDPKRYVVQTDTTVIQRCLLMTTDPGDLVLDPTCGSGTTAFVAEKWGRRWITCDTSRVAVTLAKQRLMTASYDYYELKYPHEGLKGGFIYRTVPHVTLKSIANNPDIDEIYDRLHPGITQALATLNNVLRTASPPPFAVTEGGRKGNAVDFKAPAGKTMDLPSGEKAPVGALLAWEVPFDFPEEWPTSSRPAFVAFHEARQSMQRQMDTSIAAHAEQEVLYDQPNVAKNKMRITGPFTVEAVPFPSVLSLDETRPPEEADVAIARSGESSRQHQWRDELLRTGIRGKAGQLLTFATLEALPDTRYLHVSGTLTDTGERAVISFGPEHAALEQRQVEMAMREASELFPRPKMIVFAAFAFDPEAAKDIDQTKGIVALKAQMNTDLLTDDLKKARSSNQSFWLMGQPDIEVHKQKDGLFQVEVNGFDYFDTGKGELVSGGKGKIAVWLLDTDYDERSLFPRQVFFPMSGAKDGWHKLRKDIRAELDETRLSGFHGTVSLPFEAGEHRKVAVKVVDDRGIESLKIIRLD